MRRDEKDGGRTDTYFLVTRTNREDVILRLKKFAGDENSNGQKIVHGSLSCLLLKDAQHQRRS